MPAAGRTPRSSTLPSGSHAPPRGSVLLSLAILLAALAALLVGPALSLAKSTTGRCSPASSHAKQRAHTCTGRGHTGNTHAKVKRHHAKHHHSINKKKAQHGSGQAVAAAPKPATCEDRSRPVSEGGGSFSCANGAEPVCAGGALPTLSKNGAKLLCPVPLASRTEWSEAECEDGSPPERAGDGNFACEDGSQPACADGSTPSLSDDGSMLVCLVHGAAPPSAGGEAEEDEEEAEGSAESASAASAS